MAERKGRRRRQVMVAMNTLTSIGMGPYTDHMRLYYRLGRDYPNIDFHQVVARRMSIDRFRNEAARICIQQGMDYLFFIDDDMHLPADTFGKLLKANLDIIMAHVYIRGYPYDIMAFKFYEITPRKKSLQPIKQEDLRPENPHMRKDGVLMCDAIGTAVSLIKVKVLTRTPGPWFVTGAHNTEDIYFCMRARDYYKRTTIGMHSHIICGHVLDPECISYHTRTNLKAYHESYLPPGEPERLEESRDKSGDRGEEYVKSLELDLVNS